MSHLAPLAKPVEVRCTGCAQSKSLVKHLSTMADDNTTVLRTIKFNVGGKLFETARSLIDQHEDTMLARLVSDTWMEDPTKAVFIDRDGDIFAQVLNYLRYGSIALPVTISKEMFLRDLDFYGIVPGDGTVKTCTESFASLAVKLKEDSNDSKMDNDIDALATYCATQYLSGGVEGFVELTDATCDIQSLGGGVESETKTGEDQHKTELFRTAVRVHNSQENKVLFQKALTKLGLHLNSFHKFSEINLVIIQLEVVFTG